VNEFLVAPFGEVAETWLEAARDCVREMMNVPVIITARIHVPRTSLDAKRGQYLATALLEQLLPIGRDRNAHVLGITDLDIYIPILTFMFGQAQLGGRLALVSVARLRPEFYGLPPEPGLAILRLRKEIRHEIGHTLGLVHCNDKLCAMSLSNSIVQADAKSDAFCDACRATSHAHLRKLYSGDTI
jgi:archaemetzincin